MTTQDHKDAVDPLELEQTSYDLHLAAANLHRMAAAAFLALLHRNGDAWFVFADEASTAANTATCDLNADLDGTQDAADLADGGVRGVDYTTAAQAHETAAQAHLAAAGRLARILQHVRRG